MAPYVPKYTAASPKRRFFDPWNTASTGHQRAESRMAGSTSWRQSRTAKLQSQFAAGFAGNGGKRMYDSVGAGSQDFGDDGRTDTGWEDSVRGWRGRQGIGQDQADIGAWVRSGGKVSCGRSSSREKRKADAILTRETQEERQATAKKAKLNNGDPHPNPNSKVPKPTYSDEEDLPPPSAQPQATGVLRKRLNDGPEERFSALELPNRRKPINSLPPTPRSPSSTSSSDSIPISKPNKKQPPLDSDPSPQPKPPQLFANLTTFINGTTMPMISDHKLKHLLTTHGARMSIALGRRTVTHVILGKPNAGVGKGAGGGLAGSKIEKEILRRGGSGNGIRYVSVEWILESIKAGKRLPESRFPGVNIAPAGVKSMRSLFAPT